MDKGGIDRPCLIIEINWRLKEMSKRLIVILSVVWMIVLVAGLSSAMTLSLCGVSISGEASAESERVVVSAEDYKIIEKYERLRDIQEILELYYYTEVDEETLMNGAFQGMMSALGDPYTFYYTPEDMAEAMEHQEGEYEGVGLQILGMSNGDMIVTRAFKGSSALEQGIRAGDRIVAVEGTPVSAATTQAMNEAVSMIKGEHGTQVTVTVERDGELIDFVLTRGTINMNRVEYSLLEGDVGYIMLYEFMGDDVDGFKEAVKELTKQGAKGLIIDVRSNPGGLLDDVVEICDMLLPDSLIVYIEDRYGERENFYSDEKMLDMPLVVLVNEMSASASEILAGAVQDTGVGRVVGQTTFGKGIVQTIIPFMEDGAGLQLTTATYFTPNGRSIHGSGVTPDVLVENGEYDFTTSPTNPEEDMQLKKAIEVLREEIEK